MTRDKQLELMAIFDSSYTKKELAGTLKSMVVDFIAEHRQLCLDEGIERFQLNLAEAKSFTKEHLAILVATPFCTKALFDAFRGILLDEVRMLLDELIWVDKLSHREIKTKFDIIIYNKKDVYYNPRYSRTEYTIKPEFGMFGRRIAGSHHYSHEVPEMSLFLPTRLREFLSQYIEKPKEAAFHPVAELTKTDHVYQGEQDIFLELPRIIAYKGQQQIKTNTKGRPVASTYAKMQRKLKLREFFPESKEKSLKNMRTGLLAALILTMRGTTVGTSTEQLKHLILESYAKNFSSVHAIINYLRGTNHLSTYDLERCEQIILNVFKKMPAHEWLTFSNLENFIKYNFYNIKPITENAVSRRLYYEYSEENDGYKYKMRRQIHSGRYYRSVLVPYIKGTCYLFAAYGLLDIAYDTPNVETMGKTAESPYDELKYIRLNSLGAYVLGKISEYEAPDAITQSTIRLSDNSLTIIIDEADTTAPIVLEPYTERVSPNRFRTDYSFFLKGVANQKQLDDKINLFKQSVRADIPENWERFFKDLKRKIDPLELVRNISVFHIPTDNKELLQLIAKDTTLQKMCLKAEGYHIIISNKELPKFKKRLQEFGYLLS